MDNIYVTEDREVKFDVPNVQNKLRGGEIILDMVDYIEDTKGNPKDHGRLMVTNLRLIWFSLNHLKFNLSIGYLCILSITTKTVLSKMRGSTTQALYLLTSSRNSRFEFIFTNMSTNDAYQFSSIFDIYRIYQNTYLYRELKLRTSILSSGQLKILPQEIMYNTLSGVCNLSCDQGNLGTFIITNVRIVWYADANELFNISLPYMQIGNIRVRQSKYGPALVIQSLSTGGGYTLGFRIDPPDRLANVYKELQSLHLIYSVTPIFGISYTPPQNIIHNTGSTSKFEEVPEIDDSKGSEINTKYSSYIIDNSNGTEIVQREPFYCKQLGFAMEQIKDGYTLKDLWEVIPS